jgi:nicotinamidase-related amidase
MNALTNTAFTKIGLDAMLTPDNSALILIDHQPFQSNGVRNIDVALMLNNVTALAKAAKAYGVPTLLTSVLKDRGGKIFRQITDIFPDQVPIDRTTINTWEDERVVEWVRATGKKKLVFAGLWTEVCLAFPVIHALGDGYEVYFVTDASGGTSQEAHEMGIARMIQAGAVPLTTVVFMSELQRDWARTDQAAKLAEIILDHGGATATALAWEWQLLGQSAA